MDLGPCPKNHSQKLKQEYLDLYKKSEAAGDEKQLHILNTFKANYEQIVSLRSHLPALRDSASVAAHDAGEN